MPNLNQVPFLDSFIYANFTLTPDAWGLCKPYVETQVSQYDLTDISDSDLIELIDDALFTYAMTK